MEKVVRISPYCYVHIQDLTSNITVLEVGPRTIILQDNHRLIKGPLPFVVIPPGHYCEIKDPVKKPCSPGQEHDLKHGYVEIRFYGEPFPLYPGECLVGARNDDFKAAVKKLPFVPEHKAIKLKANVDCDVNGIERKAGEMWQIEGPTTYIPSPDVKTMGFRDAIVIGYGEAIRLKAKQDLVDKSNRKRVTGEEWLVRKIGAYLPGVYEEVVTVESAYTLRHDSGLHLKATKNCVDALGKKRSIGQEWLVTVDDSETYIPEVGEEAVGGVRKTVLSKNQYCVVLDPVDKNGVNQLGLRQLRVGVSSFFLHPGEVLEAGIQEAYVLSDDEALVLSALDYYEDDTSETKKISRTPGDRWMIHGPRDYIPPIEVKVETKRKAIALSENNGIYVQNVHTGEVRAILGPQSYLLKEYEELWSKDLSTEVEKLLSLGGGYGDGTDIRKLAYFESAINPDYTDGKRDKMKVVTYKCPKGTAVQVYNYKENTARVIFGPDMVILGPHENFNVLSLSAGKPKKEGALKSILLMLGPDFITDIIEVETSDHARLRIKLGMNNHFDVDMDDPESRKAIFSISDFIGYACRNVASRIRGMVAQTPFDQFHRYSNSIIRKATFGVDSDGEVKKMLKFDANQLVITQIDVQSIEPVDENMKNSLMKSVQMAIEISTMSTEKAADHEAKRQEQIARGLLERQKLLNKKEAEESRKTLAELRAITAAVESTGQSKAEAQAKADKLLIQGESAIEVAKLKAEASAIEFKAECDTKQKKHDREIEFQKERDEMEIRKQESLAAIESSKVASIIQAIGQKTLAEIASEGPECQAQMLKSLGIQNVLITDGSTPINMLSRPDQCLY
ncbi:major vault protein-like [Dendronephthya gigantea]|uniref:major vault protein-like n=1 Tax=Dendronephthya gigantea TaxID=151771 RepID=UPI00106C3612|nr:major vault protein-like [Dendronephthya gigantea]